MSFQNIIDLLEKVSDDIYEENTKIQDALHHLNETDRNSINIVRNYIKIVHENGIKQRAILQAMDALLRP